ncbi:amino acid deaminase/aldolase [Angustibacter sp. Root456]|uniref:amino acid deaminase/aldolase n=1 Tax=Angustibacter sp. Root456 TaxID=1736539 RepID=UPI0007014235|nr:amino acid deaminase/aldolase [Angustibacter sp. Root456]KQX65777.1 alanine racemase [Angustibacter sp. Root456]
MTHADDALGRRLDAATAHLDPPLAVVDLTNLRANLDELTRRAGGRPIRLASKSVRSRRVIAEALAHTGFHGVLAYSLAEAIWLVRSGSCRDVLVAYPTVDRGALAELTADPALLAAIAIMVDDEAHLRLAASAWRAHAHHASAPVRVCLDVDSSLRLGPVHLGVRRSPLHTPDDAARLAERVRTHRELRLVGVMFYEAQVAGLPDSGPAVRLVKRRSLGDLAQRRTAVVRAVEHACGHPLELVNGGGTGSLEATATDPCVTELAAGSGLYCPTLFDGYRAFTSRPAAWFALPVVRRPAPDVATCFSGGYVASGPVGHSREPRPVAPSGLQLLRTEGAGEVQTPVRGDAARELAIGDRVWFRHAKAGELCERFDRLHLIEGDRVVDEAPTYRGEGRSFG